MAVNEVTGDIATIYTQPQAEDQPSFGAPELTHALEYAIRTRSGCANALWSRDVGPLRGAAVVNGKRPAHVSVRWRASARALRISSDPAGLKRLKSFTSTMYGKP